AAESTPLPCGPPINQDIEFALSEKDNELHSSPIYYSLYSYIKYEFIIRHQLQHHINSTHMNHVLHNMDKNTCMLQLQFHKFRM
ncbi:MAG TPA: hypothetical protein VI146_08665, partial [Nitrososphaeraceae archaeon]